MTVVRNMPDPPGPLARRSRGRGRESVSGHRHVSELSYLLDLCCEVRVDDQEALPPAPDAVVAPIGVTPSTCIRYEMSSTSGSQRARNASRSRRLKASYARRASATFSCDIAYSRSPTASRASDLDGIELQAQRLAVAQFHGLKEVVLDLDLDFAETPACLEPVADDGPIAPVDDFQGLGPHPLKTSDKVAM
jgi:hypothetical protein